MQFDTAMKAAVLAKKTACSQSMMLQSLLTQQPFMPNDGIYFFPVFCKLNL